MEILDALPVKTGEANVAYATSNSNDEILRAPPPPPPPTTPQELRDKVCPVRLDLTAIDARSTQVASRESAPEVSEAELSSAVIVDDASRMDPRTKRPAPTNEPGMKEEIPYARTKRHKALPTSANSFKSHEELLYTLYDFQADLERIRDNTATAERNTAAPTLENEALKAEIETLRAEKEDLESENEDLESENGDLSLEVHNVTIELEHRSAKVD
ncbi:hypothetical protein BKA63DRAFT_98916 [Paraphoma chrysanthemicola]|nr:hypothetical protein BKA63DRAFT_98916 [Paraphoma chrysanthemicola]